MTGKSAAQDDTGVVEVEGARLPYRIEGHGQPCLVVGSSIFYPRVFSPELREQLQLVFVDLRHFATSDASFSLDRISIELYANDIERVRQTLELGDVIVIGHSTHGCVALEYARRYPQHVRGVVVMGSYGHLSDELPDAADRLWESDASDERKEIFARAMAELTPEVRATLSPSELFVREYVAWGPRHWFDPTYDCTWMWEGVELDASIGERFFGLFETYDLAQGPGEITVPVLIAQGRYDYNAVYTAWEEHKHKLPRHTYALFDRSGHFPSLEEPERFDRAFLNWVQGLEPSSG
jgi:proline iminopeptidase